MSRDLSTNAGLLLWVLGRSSLWAWRVVAVLAVALVLLSGSAILLLRYWLLPNIDHYRPQIAHAISQAANQHITIGRVQAQWDGLRPQLSLHDVRLFDRAETERLGLQAVQGVLSWVSLVAWEPRFHSIELDGLALEVRRDANGQLSVAGIALPAAAERGNNLGDWLLQQHRIVLRGGKLTWIDETLSGTPLVLEHVDVAVEKGFGRHRFSATATPSLEMGSPLELNGEFSDGSFARPGDWRGDVYFEVDYADLSMLRHWVRLPAELSRGAGALQVWLNVVQGEPRTLTADVALSDVRATLRPDLPELQLARLQGRLGWRSQPRGVELFAQRMSFTTPDGVDLSPADIRYRRAGEGGGAGSELVFDALDLAAVSRLIDRLPVSAELRARLAQMDPRGQLLECVVNWEGDWDDSSEYSLRGKFAQVAVRPSGALPGFSSVSGEIEADQAGGRISLKTGPSGIEMPRLFLEPLPLDNLTAKVSWSVEDGTAHVRFEQIEFANAHLAGTASGTYDAIPGRRGHIDLNGALTRGDGREAWRYVPLQVEGEVRDWLRDGILAGKLLDARLRFHGDLDHFPFKDGKNGLLEIIAHARDGSIEYARGWPRLEGVSGRMNVRGNRLEISVEQGAIMGVGIGGAALSIPDVGSQDPLLHVRGEGSGATASFLRFVEDSPVDRMIQGFTRGMRAEGAGTLSLALDLPLHRVQDVQVNGRYRFAGNTLTMPGPALPPLAQFGGELDFTQNQVSMRQATAAVFGMPVRFDVERDDRGGVRVRANGRADMTTLRQNWRHPILAMLTGGTDWRVVVALRGQSSELLLQSDLIGLASTLPAPLTKAAQMALPLSVERRETASDQEAWSFTIGAALSGQFLLERAGAVRVRRGEIVAGGGRASAPNRDGVWVSGRLDSFDVDQWRRAISPTAGDLGGIALAGVDVRVGSMRLFSRNLTEVVLEASRQSAVWRASLSSREAAGRLTWSPEGRGKLGAQFSRLYVSGPTATAVALPEGFASAAEPAPDLPELDVTAEDFRLGGRALGRLVLHAAPQGSAWRIDRTELRSAEGSMVMSGLWDRGGSTPATRINAQIVAADIGKYLARLNLPKGVEGGSGSLEAQVTWIGPPYALDLPTTSGTLAVKASRGRFVEVEPGLGKLIGVVSLQSLPRRARLDFRDVFSEGFTFDEITASATVDRGVARTSDFRMIGPAARVEMSGELDLAAETQRLDVKVMPSVSESIALGAAILNPVVGLATLLAQKVMKDPIDKMAAFNYRVTGTWENPVVTQEKVASPEEQRQGRK